MAILSSHLKNKVIEVVEFKILLANLLPLKLRALLHSNGNHEKLYFFFHLFLLVGG